MKVDISTIVMLLTEEDLLEKCAISNFEFCIENYLILTFFYFNWKSKL